MIPSKQVDIKDDLSLDDSRRYEFGCRKVGGFKRQLISFIAGAWSLFQLAIPKFLLLDSVFVRCIHLSFALCLVYLCFPAIKSRRKASPNIPALDGKLRFLKATNTIPILDFVLAGMASGVALYLAIDYEGIGQRMGSPILRDLIIGIVLIILLLEAARRALGLALPCIAGGFIVYSFISERMPEIIAFKNASLTKIVTKLTLTTEGIYGVPLDVSASVVFLFVLFGAMMEKAGGGQYFIQLAYSLLGRYKGGPAKACVLASGLTGMINGSSIANTVTTGTFTIPLMKRAGFSGIKAGAIEVAASTNGQLMPPIMGAAAFIIAEYCNMTYFEVVRAAFIPAVISYLALIFIVHLEASKLGLRGLAPEELPKFTEVFYKGIPFFIPLFFLLYQLIIVRRSAQLSVYYAIIALAALMVFRNLVNGVAKKEHILLSLKKSGLQLWDSLVAGGRNMMTIGVAVSAAGIIVGIVTLGLGNVITDLIGLISFGKISLMLGITAIVSLILGMGLPTTANYIVMASLTAPAIVSLASEAGMDVPLISAHLFVFYFGILSDDTPPVGLSAYAAAAISKEDPIKTGIQGFMYDIRTAILPFMFIFNKGILLIGIKGWWHISFIFTSCLIAMFAFASLTQQFLIVRNRWYESMILLLVTLILMQPQIFQGWIGLHRFAMIAIGLFLFGGVYFMQRRRRVGRKFI